MRLSLGYLSAFQTGSGSKVSYNILESHTVRLIRDIHANAPFVFASPEVSSNGDKAMVDTLSFQYLYIVDQLIFYGTREQAGENYLQLANLLFK